MKEISAQLLFWLIFAIVISVFVIFLLIIIEMRRYKSVKKFENKRNAEKKK